MKRIVRLTESDLTRIVKRVINEQMFFGTGGGMKLGTPELDTPMFNHDMTGKCLTYKSSAEMTLELFGKLRGIAGQTNQLDKTIQSWILRLNNSMKGLGSSNDLTKVLSEIKTKEQMSSVLNAYNKKFGKTLYEDLSGEYTISWDTIWGMVKRFNYGKSIGTCKKYATQTYNA